MTIEKKRGWKQATEEIVGECGLDCRGATLEGHKFLSVVVEERKGTRHYGVPLCDRHRRLLCTCDACIFYEPDLHPDDPEDDDEDSDFWDGYCQLSNEAEDTDASDWCGEWTQAEPLALEEVEGKILARLAKAAEKAEDSEESGELSPWMQAEIKQRLAEHEAGMVETVSVRELRKRLNLEGGDEEEAVEEADEDGEDAEADSEAGETEEGKA